MIHFISNVLPNSKGNRGIICLLRPDLLTELFLWLQTVQLCLCAPAVAPLLTLANVAELFLCQKQNDQSIFP